MKYQKIILSCLMLATGIASAQSISTPAPQKEHTLGLAVEPHWLLIGGLGAKVDRRISDRTAIGLGGLYIPPREALSKEEKKKDSSKENYKWTTYEVYVGPTFNLTGNYDTNGWFLTPAIGYAGYKISEYSKFNLSGSTEAFLFRTSTGYQWVKNDMRLLAGAGFKVLDQREIIVKDGAGNVLLREKAGALGGLVIDFHVAWLF